MPWNIAAAYVCLVFVAGILWYVPLERLANMLWVQRGMEHRCTEVIQKQNAEILKLKERLDLRDETIRENHETIRDQKETIKNQKATIGGMKYDADKYKNTILELQLELARLREGEHEA